MLPGLKYAGLRPELGGFLWSDALGRDCEGGAVSCWRGPSRAVQTAFGRDTRGLDRVVTHFCVPEVTRWAPSNN